MKKLKIHDLLLVVLSFTALSTYGMLTRAVTRRSYLKNYCMKIKTGNFGIAQAMIPQTATGIFGQFRLDRDYYVGYFLAPYIARNIQKPLREACLVGWQNHKIAYEKFLQHNSSAAIRKALDDDVIDMEYAKRALYFTQKVAWAFQNSIEEDREFTHKYSNDAEQYIYCDESLFSKECRQLLDDIKHEQDQVAIVVDFLRQKPEKEAFVVESIRMGKKETTNNRIISSFGIGLKQKVEPIKVQHNIVVPTVPQIFDGILGNFRIHKNDYTIKDYLRKYIARDLEIEERYVNDQARLHDIKKAFEIFLQHNHPNIIQSFFKGGWITEQYAEKAMRFTSWVAQALEEYLYIDHPLEHEIDAFELHWEIKKMRNKYGHYLRDLTAEKKTEQENLTKE